MVDFHTLEHAHALHNATAGTVYIRPERLALPKGELTVTLQVRHEEAARLEALRAPGAAPLLVTRPVPGGKMHVIRVLLTVTRQLCAAYSVPDGPNVTRLRYGCTDKKRPIRCTSSPPSVRASTAPGPSKLRISGGGA